MKGLWHLCKKRGGLDCPPDIFALINTEDKFLLPDKIEMEKYNDICKKCRHRHFKITGKKCLVCAGELEALANAPSRHASLGGIEHFYECSDCGTPYYSYVKLD